MVQVYGSCFRKPIISTMYIIIVFMNFFWISIKPNDYLDLIGQSDGIWTDVYRSVLGLLFFGIVWFFELFKISYLISGNCLKSFFWFVIRILVIRSNAVRLKKYLYPVFFFNDLPFFIRMCGIEFCNIIKGYLMSRFFIGKIKFYILKLF